MTASVPPDREAAVEVARAFFRMDIARGLVLDSDMDRLVDALWPLVCQAREDGKAEGRREAAEAIEAEAESAARTAGATQVDALAAGASIRAQHMRRAARLARGDQKGRTDGRP